MYELKNTPDEFRAQQARGKRTGDYTEYIEVILEFISLNKPYLMVEGEDEDGYTAAANKSRFEKAVDLLCLKDTVRLGFWTPQGEKTKLILYRRDMEL